MRLFYAHPIEGMAMRTLTQNLREIKSTVGGKLTRSENLHLTQVFLGEQDQTLLPMLSEILETVAGQTSPFDVSLGEIGCFKKTGGDILWRGIEQPDKLLWIHQRLEELLRQYRIDFRPSQFRAHITLARGARIDVHSIKELENLSGKGNRMPVRTLTLYESCRINGQLCYVPRASAALKGSL